MSLAGIRSNRGDSYQRSVALYWVVRMLADEKIADIQVDVISVPGEVGPVYGDDIVINFSDGKRHYIQAKVNQPNHQYWRLTDKVLRAELISARKQLLADHSGHFIFYSRTPFGALERLVQERGLHRDLASFQENAPQGQQETLTALSEIWDEDIASSFERVRRLDIGSHNSFDEWENLSLELLKISFSQPETALDLIYLYVDRQHSKLGDPQFLIDRHSLLAILEKRGIYHSLSFNEQSLIEKFESFSTQGRLWARSIGGVKIARPELDVLKEAIESDSASILLADDAGGGKTCILLDLMDYLDSQEHIAALFIRGDLFASVETLADLVELGLPEDLIAQCARLAEKRAVVVVVDSMDVLAVGRSHKCLQCFLGLIAKLSNVPNITTIAASRAFDAKYDPLLREANWDQTVVMKAISFDKDVKPLLNSWNIEPDGVADSLQVILRNPQRLKLFYHLIKKGVPLSDINEQDLFDLYIRVQIEHDQLLGLPIIEMLQDIANELLTLRSYNFSRNRLKLSDQVVNRLLGLNVLHEVDLHQLMFSHQTLADAFRIRQAQQNGTTLLSFVTAQAQLPFVRPAVRSFLLSLRSVQPDQFNKQLRKLLTSTDVSMHLKRLAVETLADMCSRAEDVSTISLLSSTQAPLLRRFLDSAKSEDWFSLLYNEWLPIAPVGVLKANAGTILNYFGSHLDGNEAKMLGLWLRAFDESWNSPINLVWTISSDMKDLKQWTLPGLRELLDKLLDADRSERGDTGTTICRYIEMTNEGDDLLWRFITNDAQPTLEMVRSRKLSLNCRSHIFPTEGYLEQRLKQSDELFSSAIEYLLQLARDCSVTNDEFPFDRNLLHSTSYTRRHSNHDSHHVSAIHEFLDAIESAMRYRSIENDSCWQTYEPELRTTRELGLRYLLLEAYASNVSKNIDGIVAQLQNVELFKHGVLDFELGYLSKLVYPHLPHKNQVDYQDLIINLVDDLDEKTDWISRKKLYYLSWIPGYLRLSGITDFIESCEIKYGKPSLAPDITSGGGMVRSPVDRDQLIKLNHEHLLKILSHYDKHNDYDRRGIRSSGVIGGRESLEADLNAATSLVPMHFLPLVGEIEAAELSKSYIYSIINGITTHLSVRFDNVTSSGWQEVEPLPEGEKLARSLLDLVERYCNDDERGYSTPRAIKACGSVLNDDNSLDRMCFQLWRLGMHSSPELSKDDDANGLVEHGINSTRGVAAETVVKICNRRLELGYPLTTDLVQLLHRYASDPSMVVRATFLMGLPYLHSKEDQLGWDLIGKLRDGAKPRLIKHFERSMYYQYHSHFEAVRPFLELMENNEDESTCEAWGRLATLSFLDGHIDEESLWQATEDRHESCLTGMGQVFVENLGSNKSSVICIEGLAKLFSSNAPKEVFSDFEHSLEHKEWASSIPFALIEIYLGEAPFDNISELHGLFAWLEKHVHENPNEILILLESLLTRLQDQSERMHFYRPEALVATLNMLLQDADLSDEEEYINRVLVIQDWFLDHGLKELEEMYDAA